MSFAPELDPTAGEPAGDQQADQTPAPYQAPERTFTQADVDRIAANERSRARRQYEREYESRQPQAQPQYEADPVQTELRTMKQQMTEFALDSAIGSLAKQYNDFEPNLRTILETVTDKGLDKASNLSIPAVLELAYRYWQHDNLVALTKKPPVDVAAIERAAADKAVKDYIAGKAGKAAATPSSEGAGGNAPSSAESRDKRASKKGALDAALERISKSKAAVA